MRMDRQIGPGKGEIRPVQYIHENQGEKSWLLNTTPRPPLFQQGLLSKKNRPHDLKSRPGFLFPLNPEVLTWPPD